MSTSARTGSDAELTALVRALEVHQAELEAQNHELIATIDELQRSNGALALARDRYHALYELAPVALVTIDRQGTIHDVNEAAVATLGARREQMIARRFALFTDEAERHTIAAYIEALFSSGALRDRPATLGDAAAAMRQVRLHGVVVRESGPPRAVIAIVDVSAVRAADRARYEIEQRVEQVRRQDSLTNLAGGVAHDFNNLLTVVLAGIQYAREQLAAGSSAAESLDDAHQAARQATDLAQQMLAYSGRVGRAASLTDLGGLIRELAPTLDTIRLTAPLIIYLADARPWLRCDPAQIRQLILALVRNAAEAMADRPGAIELTVREALLSNASIASLASRSALDAGRYLVLEVRDTGIGMDADVKSRALEPFFSTKFVGRGLGLAVVDGIVRAHRGALTIDSETGRGTAVCVYFPASPRPAIATTASTELPVHPLAMQRNGGTVLVADDDDSVRHVLLRALTHLGLTVVLAGDGDEALKRFGAEPERFDAVLLDFKMPRMDGSAAAAAIHALRPDVPLALITGFGDIPEETSSVFVATLAKPFDSTALQQLVARLLPR